MYDVDNRVEQEEEEEEKFTSFSNGRVGESEITHSSFPYSHRFNTNGHLIFFFDDRLRHVIF